MFETSGPCAVSADLRIYQAQQERIDRNIESAYRVFKSERVKELLRDSRFDLFIEANTLETVEILNRIADSKSPEEFTEWQARLNNLLADEADKLAEWEWNNGEKDRSCS